jgi:hypothetical protein
MPTMRRKFDDQPDEALRYDLTFDEEVDDDVMSPSRSRFDDDSGTP